MSRAGKKYKLQVHSYGSLTNPEAIPILKDMSQQVNWKNPPVYYHIWAHKKLGLISHNSYSTQAEKRSKEWVYLGYTTDIVYPKKLNTGRILHQDKKLSASRKTGSRT